MKVIMKCVNIKFLDKLGCFHYILNPPRIMDTAPMGNGFDYTTNWHEINVLLPIPFDDIKLYAKLCHKVIGSLKWPNHAPYPPSLHNAP